MPETVYAQRAPSSTSFRRAFEPVTADELGFALTLFVAAGSGTLCAGREAVPRLSDEQTSERERLFAELLFHAEDPHHSKGFPHESTLKTAFSAVWSQYKPYELRDSICARVLSFYFLMVQTGGKAVARWTTQNPDRPEEEVLLDPAVVEGLANVCLHPETGLIEAQLTEAIDQAYAKRCLA